MKCILNLCQPSTKKKSVRFYGNLSRKEGICIYTLITFDNNFFLFLNQRSIVLVKSKKNRRNSTFWGGIVVNDLNESY